MRIPSTNRVINDVARHLTTNLLSVVTKYVKYVKITSVTNNSIVR